MTDCMILLPQAPCCEKYYNCRFCHNDKEDHELDRKTVQRIKCLQCGSCQSVSCIS